MAVWVTLSVVPPILLMGAERLVGMIEVAWTGMCPAMPPDIPPYPCSVTGYLERHWGAFELMGTVFYSIESVAFATWVVSGWAVHRLLRQRSAAWATGWMMACAVPVLAGSYLQFLVYGTTALVFAAPVAAACSIVLALDVGTFSAAGAGRRRR